MEVFRLQEAYAPLSGAETQRWQEAIDVLPVHTAIVQVRCTVAGPAGALVFIQHSARTEDTWFLDATGVSFAVDVVGNASIVISDPLRYLRWRYAASAAGAQFIIDVVAREV